MRSNTPRPLSFEAMISSSGLAQRSQQGEAGTSFPTIAPSAPPLPEELASPLPGTAEPMPEAGSIEHISPSSAEEKRPEELLIFEYGLEMDAAILNSPERLSGQALPAGPAVLRGYSLMLGAQQMHGGMGPTLAAIVPSAQVGDEVWGVLYRVPQQLRESKDNEPSLLDTIHAAIEPQKFFKGEQVVVHEKQSDREIECVAYVATDIACKQLHLVSVDQWSGDTQFIQRLTAIARKQRLPERYIRQYGLTSLSAQIPTMVPPSVLPEALPEEQGRSERSSFHTMTDTDLHADLHRSMEADTEPLPTFGEQESMLSRISPTPKLLVPISVVPMQRWLIFFALYLALLLLVVLTFSVFQGMGMGNGVLNNHFMLLDVPWLIMLYGLLGGCISCIVSLRSVHFESPPLFVIITWFTRPFIGALLAIFAHLLLTSGFFVMGDSAQQHMPFFLLVAAFAGYCEGWIFAR
ncbi:hypothetical protein KTT_12720 [Tengunoibacter tsumagoiensis]|uniref:Uncharacterized protein n=1 Tax=Tengunoibacter tsumagoiensis TaxID=2014871 RepID=A0A401ZX19_9CHLR|nr:hypothetical protein KTT_12720 [Tengunoibacter tsumagoiensis]